MTVDQQTEIRMLRFQLRNERTTLRGVSSQLLLVDRVWVIAAALAAFHDRAVIVGGLSEVRTPGGEVYTVRGPQTVPRPKDVGITKRSPLVIELALNAVLPLGLTGTAAGLLVYFLRHPAELGAFVPKVLSGWRRNMLEAEVLKFELELAKTLTREVGGGPSRSGGRPTPREFRGTSRPTLGDDDYTEEERLVDAILRRTAGQLILNEPQVLDADGIEEFRPPPS